MKDETDLAIADAGALGQGQALDGAAIERVDAVSGRIEEPEDGKQRGLAATGGTGDGDVFPLANVDVNAGERMGLDLIGEKHFGDAFEFDQ